METGSALSLYIHIPFCLAKCDYCDFNSHSGLEALFNDYAAGLVSEIETADRARPRTIYLGGGTPSVLPLSNLAQVLDGIRRMLPIVADTEISIEANPGTVDCNKLVGLRALGVNRLSLGVQSFDDAELRLLGRIHCAVQAVKAFRSARQAGFQNVNLDLIYGLPGQSLTSWQATLNQALDLQPDHLSLYSLTIEDGTPMSAAIAGGALPHPDPDLAADMYESSQAILASAGFFHYEISNWAKTPDLVCKHNLTYWRNEAYLGIGAGAHSWFGARRWSNTAWPAEYVAQLRDGRPPIAAEEIIPPELEIGETMIMGLRLLHEGVSYERFCRRFGVDLRQTFSQELHELAQLGLLQTDDERVRLSEKGRLLGNQVFLRFLPD